MGEEGVAQRRVSRSRPDTRPCPRASSPRAPDDACTRNGSAGTGSEAPIGADEVQRQREVACRIGERAVEIEQHRREPAAVKRPQVPVHAAAGGLAEGGKVVDRRIGLEAVGAGQRVVGHAGHRDEVEARASREGARARPAARTSTSRACRAAAGCSTYSAPRIGEQIRLRIAVDRREDDGPAGLRAASRRPRRWTRGRARARAFPCR